VHGQAIFSSVVGTRFAVAQLLDEGQYLLTSVSQDDTVAGLVEDMKEISDTFNGIKCAIRRKLVDLKQTFENNVVEVFSATVQCDTIDLFLPRDAMLAWYAIYILFIYSALTLCSCKCVY